MPAPRAGIFFPQVSPADAAVHPTGGDELIIESGIFHYILQDQVTARLQRQPIQIGIAVVVFATSQTGMLDRGLIICLYDPGSRRELDSFFINKERNETPGNRHALQLVDSELPFDLVHEDHFFQFDDDVGRAYQS